MRKLYLTIEFTYLFIFIPLMFTSNISLYIKGVFILFGVIHVLLITKRKGLMLRKQLIKWPQDSEWKFILMKFILLASLTIIGMDIFDPKDLFAILLKKPLVWLSVSASYFIVSVYPQEFLFRAFFFERYNRMFKNLNQLIFVNALIFSFAHIMFNSVFVLVLTFFGSIIFSLTYIKTKSIMLVSIEHFLYGAWLFTVGMGGMLGFPLPD